MRRAEVIKETATLLHQRGYFVEGIVIAVPKDLSVASTFYRYETGKKQDGFARYVTLSNHQKTFAAIGASLDKINQSDSLDRFRLYERKPGAGYQKIYDTDNLKQYPGWSNSLADAFRKITVRRLTLPKYQWVANIWRQIEHSAQERDAEEQYANLIHELRGDFERSLWLPRMFRRKSFEG
jgi:hypothetical protein